MVAERTDHQGTVVVHCFPPWMPGNLGSRDEGAGAQERDLGGSGGGGEPPAIDPIIQGLLSRLPKSGDVWPEADRKLWLQLLEGSFKLIYKDKSDKKAHARRTLTMCWRAP
jgi:hypothetical protein